MFSQDIFIEVGHGPTLIDNNIMLSKVSVTLATEGVALVHNLMLGKFALVGKGTDSIVEGVNRARYTPYHIHHRTEVAGFMTILHGDDRFYNNIFVQNWPVEPDAKEQENQEVGTHVFDEYPTYEEWISHFELDKPADMGALEKYHFSHLPVWANGNAYFNGAKPWKKEAENLVNQTDKVYVELEEKDGSYSLKTNLYDFLKDFETGIINSDILGCAFEPEQRFENPDGTAILFNEDYFGEHRGIAALPGPFADGRDAGKKLW